jgi:hypothetical protein
LWSEFQFKLQSKPYAHAPHFHRAQVPTSTASLPLTNNDFLGFGFAVVSLMVAAGGGIGGGGIQNPFTFRSWDLLPKHAIPFVQRDCLFGGAIANTLLNKRKRHSFSGSTLGRLGFDPRHGTL